MDSQAPSPPREPRRPTRLNSGPLLLFRLGLGFLLPPSQLRLVHRGRRTGRHREAFLEVLSRSDEEVFVAALWGPASDWYQNLRVHPAIAVQIGRRQYTPAHRFVPSAEAGELLDRYQRRHPRRVRIRQDRFIRRPLTPEHTPVVAFSIPRRA